MKFTKAMLAAAMLTVTAAPGVKAVTVTANATVTINVTFIQPSCDITVPTSYNLGTLTPGTPKEHGDLNITWTCEGGTPVKTALTAAIVTGTPDGDEKVRLMTGSQATGASLSLKEVSSGNSSFIKLTGPDAKNYFCSDAKEATGMRTCTLRPVTEVSPKGPFGLASATLRFEVGYL